MDSPYAYYNLSKRLDHSDYEKLWQKIGDGIELETTIGCRYIFWALRKQANTF